MAYQCCKIAVSIDPQHAEALNNMGVLEVRRGAPAAGAAAFAAAHDVDDGVYEAPYNAALAAFRSGNFQNAYNLVNKSLAIFEGHADSQTLLQELQQHFTLL
jgi:tetratricopeptide repeat protein 8